MSQKIQSQPSSAPSAPASTPSAGSPVQGEGDYEASRRYRQEVGDFLAKADVEQLAERAAPKSALEARELAMADERGRLRSKGDDPADVGAMYPGRDKGSA